MHGKHTVARGKAFGVLLVVLGIANESAIRAQSPAVAPPRFEVASIKPAGPHAGGLRFRGDPGRIHYTSVTLREVLTHAYQIKTDQIEGPESLDAQGYDIDATLPPGAPDGQIPAMLQTLLEERFRLRSHWVEKSVKGYVLRLRAGRGGSDRLKQSDAPGRGGVAFLGDKFQATNATMSAFCDLLSTLLAVPVVDETGMQGGYDFKLAIDIAPAALSGNVIGQPSIGASILVAVKDLGLTLDSRTLARKHLVIDSVDRIPSAN